MDDCQYGNLVTLSIFILASSEDNIIFLLDTGLGGVIFRMDLNTQSYVPIPMNSLYTPTAFDYDATDGRIYFVDYKLRQLMSVHFSGTDVRELKQLDSSTFISNHFTHLCALKGSKEA
jgi:hypothetical protein